jgi:hypothetical protein
MLTIFLVNEVVDLGSHPVAAFLTHQEADQECQKHNQSSIDLYGAGKEYFYVAPIVVGQTVKTMTEILQEKNINKENE